MTGFDEKWKGKFLPWKGGDIKQFFVTFVYQVEKVGQIAGRSKMMELKLDEIVEEIAVMNKTEIVVVNKTQEITDTLELKYNKSANFT